MLGIVVDSETKIYGTSNYRIKHLGATFQSATEAAFYEPAAISS